MWLTPPWNQSLPVDAGVGLPGCEKIRVKPGAILPWDIDPVELGHGGVDLDKMIAFARETLNLALPAVVQGVLYNGSLVCTSNTITVGIANASAGTVDGASTTVAFGILRW